MNKHIRNGLALAGVAFVGAANAAVDVTAATAEITDAKTGVLAIGLAVFSLTVGVKLYKWFKAAL
jgi:hypothetical protein